MRKNIDLETNRNKTNRGCDFREMKISTENKIKNEFFFRLKLTHSQRASCVGKSFSSTLEEEAQFGKVGGDHK